MKILIDIPEAFEVDYNENRFAEFFLRCLADMGTCCGNYEQETAEMMEKAFSESKTYDPDRVVKQLEELKRRYDIEDFAIKGIICKAIEIVKGGGVNGN